MEAINNPDILTIPDNLFRIEDFIEYQCAQIRSEQEKVHRKKFEFEQYVGSVRLPNSDEKKCQKKYLKLVKRNNSWPKFSQWVSIMITYLLDYFFIFFIKLTKNRFPFCFIFSIFLFKNNIF